MSYLQDDMVVKIKNDMIMDMSVEVFKSFDTVSATPDQWDDFVASVDGEIYSTYDWCSIWWKHYGSNRKLNIFIFRHDGQIVGIVPLFMEKIRFGPVWLRVLKLIASDYSTNTVSIPIRPEYVDSVVVNLQNLISDMPYDVINFGKLSALYDCKNSLYQACLAYFGSSHTVIQNDGPPQTYFKLSDSLDSYLAELSHSKRNTIRRHRRRAAAAVGDRDLPVVAVPSDRQNVEQFFDEFMVAHQKRWNKAGKAGHFGDWPGSEQFHRDLIDANIKTDRLCLSKITASDTAVGYIYGYVFSNRYLDFLSSRSDSDVFAKVSIGRILYSEMIRLGSEKGLEYIDSMPGFYDFKIAIGGQMFTTSNIAIRTRTISSRVRQFVFGLFATILDAAYYRIWYSRIAPKMFLRRKSLWHSWIRTRIFSWLANRTEKMSDNKTGDDK
ncbi:MAG: GNAT family N-acetyltransferase [Planctomycetes bacterium]|nr:GNAT family N-acetyltransferase [Planctomycetota bacterium]